MSIYLRSFMHKAPLESLRAFLEDISVAAFVDVNWQMPRPSLVDSLAETIFALDDLVRDRIYSDVDRIGQFMKSMAGACSMECYLLIRKSWISSMRATM